MMNRLSSLVKKYWIFLTLFMLTAITILSLWPLAELPPIPGSDKTHHLIAYALLMLPTAVKKPKYWYGIGLFFILWSGGIELLQPYVNRYGEVKDLVANIAGLVCGCLIIKLLNSWMAHNSNS